MIFRYTPARVAPVLWALLSAALATSTAGADDVRVNQIMMDVQDLQRTVRDQARRIDELERSLAQSRFSTGNSTVRGQPLKPPGEEWLQSRNWERVRPGMAAQDVIAVLGAPASMRESDDGKKTLLYAMQLGASGYLAGSVEIANDRVVEVTRPVLK